MWLCCFKKNKVTTQEKFVNDDSNASMKNAPVTGSPIFTIKKVSNKKIPVAADTNYVYLMDLVEQGWCTDGETIQLNGRAHIWYTLDEERNKEKIPLTSNQDAISEYKWKRIKVEEELDKYQAQGWMARSLCHKTNKIWVCRPKELKGSIVKSD